LRQRISRPATAASAAPVGAPAWTIAQQGILDYMAAQVPIGRAGPG